MKADTRSEDASGVRRDQTRCQDGRRDQTTWAPVAVASDGAVAIAATSNFARCCHGIREAIGDTAPYEVDEATDICRANTICTAVNFDDEDEEDFEDASDEGPMQAWQDYGVYVEKKDKATVLKPRLVGVDEVDAQGNVAEVDAYEEEEAESEGGCRGHNT